MFGRLKAVFSKETSPVMAVEPTIETVLKPQSPFFAIGDIHGCDDLLVALLEKIHAHADAPIVFVGDYVDRGPKSAQALTRLFELQQSDPEKYICLMGNHEQMMLEFIDDPIGRGARWLRFGGVDTLRSFGISDVKEKPKAEDAMDLADALEAAMPKGLQRWINDLPVLYTNGNVHCVHAGVDPHKAITGQSRNTMIWGHEAFMKEPREDGECVIFGHVITPEPDVRDGRIAIDTGAYKSGCLTAVYVEQGVHHFL